MKSMRAALPRQQQPDPFSEVTTGLVGHPCSGWVVFSASIENPPQDTGGLWLHLMHTMDGKWSSFVSNLRPIRKDTERSACSSRTYRTQAAMAGQQRVAVRDSSPEVGSLNFQRERHEGEEASRRPRNGAPIRPLSPLCGAMLAFWKETYISAG